MASCAVEVTAAPRTSEVRAETFLEKHFRLLAVCIIAASILASIAFLTTRNMYDDEVGSFHFISKPVAAIWQSANSSDFHPPGMYVLSHFFYSLTGSVRWTTLGPLAVLYTGLVVFFLATRKHFIRDKAAALFFCALLFLHPQLLMWGNSIRWYPYWTGIALVFITVGLSLYREGKPPSIWTCGVLGLMGGALFYLNYMSLLFLAAFAVAYAVRYSGRQLWKLLIVGATVLLLALPQLVPFLTVHLPKRGLQQFSRLAAVARAFHATFMSESMLPWHPMALLFVAVVAAPLAVILLRQIRRGNTVWKSLGALFVVLFVLAAASGLGGKPRSFIVLAPLFAFLAATAFLTAGLRYRIAATVVTACWMAFGIGHLLARTGTAKGGMNDHPEEIVRYIAEKSAGQSAIIFLHDPALAYVLNDAGQQWTVVSVSGDAVHGLASGEVRLKGTPMVEFVIQSYTGDQGEVAAKLDQRLQQARAAMMVAGSAKFGRDEQVAIKRRLPGLGDAGKLLPEYRFDVAYGYPKPRVRWESFAAIFRWDKPVSVSGIR
ncbi:MAG TPA: hypothetical protein VEU96_09050 [Bryobacteraceae bacterium]|nr:hypothetical protein [Bryobacteraceae bacterium]